jgi:hypothetical protein
MEMLSGYCSPRRAWWLVCKAKGTWGRFELEFQGFLEFNVRIYTTGVINPPLKAFLFPHIHILYTFIMVLVTPTTAAVLQYVLLYRPVYCIPGIQ